MKRTPLKRDTPKAREWLQRSRLATAVRDKFWSKVERGDGCWEWQGAKSGLGYGTMYYDGKARRAHRLAWTFTNGPIPEGLCVCHACDNPSCVNPDHLWLGTHADNMADRDSKGRAVSSPGEKNGFAKLTERLVLSIREAVAGGRSYVQVADTYQVTPENVGMIARGETWKHVGGPRVGTRAARGLTESEVVEIRHAVADGAEQRDMSLKYGVSDSVVSELVRGLSWRGAGGPTRRKHLRPANSKRKRKLFAKQFGEDGKAAFVRGQRCDTCDSLPPCDPSHYPSRGAGGTSENMFPQCRKCHDLLHYLGVDTYLAGIDRTKGWLHRRTRYWENQWKKIASGNATVST